jgi:hypothetical protein
MNGYGIEETQNSLQDIEHREVVHIGEQPWNLRKAISGNAALILIMKNYAHGQMQKFLEKHGMKILRMRLLRI